MSGEYRHFLVKRGSFHRCAHDCAVCSRVYNATFLFSDRLDKNRYPFSLYIILYITHVYTHLLFASTSYTENGAPKRKEKNFDALARTN